MPAPIAGLYESEHLAIQDAARILRDAIHYDELNGFRDATWQDHRDQFIQWAAEQEKEWAEFDRDCREQERLEHVEDALDEWLR